MVLTAVVMKTEVFWDVPSCVLVNSYRLSSVGQSKNQRYFKHITF